MRLHMATKEDVIRVREQCRDVSMKLGFPEKDQTQVVTAVSELVLRLCEHGTTLVSFHPREESERHGLAIEVEYYGSELTDLLSLTGQEQERPESTDTLTRMKWLIDECHIQPFPEQGALIQLTKWKTS